MGADPIQYLEREVLESAVTDIVEVAAYHARHHKRDTGHFSTPRQVFCYADHLGWLAFGDRESTRRTVRFIREFFPPRYEPFAELVVAMWRHGTVHQLKPYSYRGPLAGGAAEEVEVRWLSTNHNRRRERAQHMLVFPVRNQQSRVFLVVNSCQLADDLVASVNRLIGALREDELDLPAITQRVASLGDARSYQDAGKSMAQQVKEQIREAWRRQGGMLDEDGNVIEEHPEAKLK